MSYRTDYLDYDDYLDELEAEAEIEREERREYAEYMNSLAEMPEDESILYTVWATYDNGETFKRIYIGHYKYMAVQLADQADRNRDTRFTTYHYPMDVTSVINRKVNRALAEIDGVVFPAGEPQFRLNLGN